MRALFLAALILPWVAEAARVLAAPGEWLSSVDTQLTIDVTRRVLSLVPVEPTGAWSFGGVMEVHPQLGAGFPPLEMRSGAGHMVDVQFSSDGTLLVGTGSEGVDVWDTHSWRSLRSLRLDVTEIFDARFLPGSDRLVVLGSGGSLVLWSPASGETVRRFDAGAVGGARVVRVFPEGGAFATGVARGQLNSLVAIWGVDGGEPLRMLAHADGHVTSLEAAPGPRLVLHGQGDISVVDAETGEVQVRLGAPAGVGPYISVTSRGASVAALFGGHVVLWDIDSERRLVLNASVDTMLLLPGDRLLTLAPSEVSIMCARTGRRLVQMALSPLARRGEANVLQAAVSPGGEVVAGCGWRTQRLGMVQWVAFWEASTGRLLGESHRLTGGLPCPVAVGPRRSVMDAWTAVLA